MKAKLINISRLHLRKYGGVYTARVYLAAKSDVRIIFFLFYCENTGLMTQQSKALKLCFNYTN